MTQTGVPRLSVILPAPRDFTLIQKTVRHIRAQTRAADIELVIATFSRADLKCDPSAFDGLAHVCIVQVGDIQSVTDARIAALARARAPIIAFAEDHAFPSPQWAEVLLEAHAKPCAAVAVEMQNANPSSLSRADLLINFGAWLAPARRGYMPVLPGHNTSYKREILEGYGARLSAMLDTEVLLHHDLSRRGHSLVLETRAYVAHLNISRWRPFCAHKFWGGRIFAATRARQEKWSAGRRVLYALGAPLVPFVRFKRMLPDVRRTGALDSFDPVFLLALAIGLVIHALGEAVGYLAGTGRAFAAYAEMELHRAVQLRQEERYLAFE